MKRYNQEEFELEMEKRHEQWVKDGGVGFIDFRGIDLRGINFRSVGADDIDFHGSDLRGANFANCIFTAVNFFQADLRGANFAESSAYGEDDVVFEDADLRGACFDGASFESVNFSGADLRGAETGNWAPGACFNKANFRAANLKGTCFYDCEFQNADFSYADFTGADLQNSDFKEALLRDTIFDEANISGSSFEHARLNDYDDDDWGIETHRIHRGLKGVVESEETPFIVPMSCPTHGSFIGWYGTVVATKNDRIFGILKLEIPKDVRRSSAEDEKCRCDKAKLIKILDVFGHDLGVSETTISDGAEEYPLVVGQITEVKNSEENRFKEGAGIPFYTDYHVMMEACY